MLEAMAMVMVRSGSDSRERIFHLSSSWALPKHLAALGTTYTRPPIFYLEGKSLFMTGLLLALISNGSPDSFSPVDVSPSQDLFFARSRVLAVY